MPATQKKTSRPNLKKIHLASGAHDTRDEGVCAMELVAWMANEPHSDHPECTCPVISAFVRRWNDDLGDDDRDRLLKPLLPLLIGTNVGEAASLRRPWMAIDWTVRTFTPAWLRLAKLEDEAKALESLAELTDADSIDAAMPAICAVQQKSAAARDAARDDARAAAWAAARAAARDGLKPVRISLQDSSVALVKRMCAVKP